ncbi:MAG: tail fiber domain-containing protein [Candidatus Udaeobacter sp.]
MKNRNMMHRLPILALALGLFALCSTARAVSPPPDGGYAGGNTAEGQSALLSLTTGIYNTGIGIYSLLSVSDGDANTAVGAGTLFANTGGENTAVGAGALFSNTTTGGNTAEGAFALFSSTGLSNTAVGDRALLLNTSGGFNTAVGQAAMLNNTTGSSNIAIGVQALGNNDTGSSNIAIGNVAGTGVNTATNVICIGQVSGADVDSRTYIANIAGTTVSGAGTDSVTVDLTTGLLGHLSSSRRYKERIQPMNNASEALYRLKPVTYCFKKEIDASQSLDYGLIAEDVAKVDPNLAIRDAKGQIESVRYTAINVMLLNEFLKAHRKSEEQEAKITQLTEDIEKLVAHVKQQDSQIQTMSVEIETSKAAQQIVVNNP